MDTVHHYEVTLNWESERKGLISSPVLHSNIEVATPPEFPKGIPGIWSPGHLLVAAVNSCLMTTFLAIAENSKFNFINFESKADGKLDKVDGKLMISEIVLSPTLTISNEADEEKALRILQKSEAACLISNSIKSSIIFQPQIKIASFNNNFLPNYSI
jgi:peroxiredoxin-like protein